MSQLQREIDLRDAYQTMYEKYYSKRIIPVKNLSQDYSKMYVQTNERLNEFCNQLDFQNINNALVVASSGDHMLNLAYRGVPNVDMFDSNRLTEYFIYGIKIPAILMLSYNEYKDFIKTTFLDKNDYTILFKVISNAEPIYREFWLDFFQKMRTNESSFEFSKYLYPINLTTSKDYNGFLIDEESYNVLKSNLKKFKTTFFHKKIEHLPSIPKRYDLIMLSNILDYQTFETSSILAPWQQEKLLTELFENNLTPNGAVAYRYMYIGDNKEKLVLPEQSIMTEYNLNGDYIRTLKRKA